MAIQICDVKFGIYGNKRLEGETFSGYFKDMKIAILIGMELKRQRKQSGKSQKDTAADLMVTRETLSRWESGLISLESAHAYLGHLGLPARRFLEGCVVAQASDQEVLESAGRIIRRDV